MIPEDYQAEERMDEAESWGYYLEEQFGKDCWHDGRETIDDDSIGRVCTVYLRIPHHAILYTVAYTHI